MIGWFQRGELVDIYENFVQDPAPPGVTYTISIEYTDQTGALVPVATGLLMTKIGSNRWLYRYSVPADAPYGVYNVRFARTDPDGSVSDPANTDSFQVTAGVTLPRQGAGLSTYAGTVRSNGNPISGAKIEFWYLDNNKQPIRLAATTTSDASANYVVYLDPGTYLMIVDATGYNRYTDLRTVT